MQKGLEIHFFDLFRYLAKKWMIILVFIVALGFAANCFGYHKSSISIEKERKALEEYAEKTGSSIDNLPDYMTAELADLRGDLTEEEASFVEAIAKLYMYRMWASDRINGELVIGEPDQGDLEMVQTLYYANEGVQSAVQVMTSAEKSYYNVLVKELSGTDMRMTEKSITVPGFLQPKWLFIGAVLGMLLGVFILSMAFALSTTLRVASDMETPFGIPVLTTITKANEEEGLITVSKGIQRLINKSKQSSLIVCYVNTREAESASEILAETIAEEEISVTLVTVGSSSFIAEIADADTVLFVEQIGKSRYKNIEANISTCRKFSVHTVGCVVIE